MFSNTFRLFPLALWTLCLALLLGTIPSCCDKKNGEYDSYDTYDTYDTDDPVEPAVGAAVRDSEDGCLFLAEATDWGTQTLRSATVSGPGDVIPSSVSLSKDGGATAVAGSISSALGGGDGWTAVFAVNPLDGSPNGAVGTELDLDGTWSITLTVDNPYTCADIEEPLTLTLVPDGE